MNPSLESLKQKLKNKNISLSYQRLKVLEYLSQNLCHPTVDKIYTDLRKEISTLSKTTVYNTLKLLEDAGLVKVLTIEDNETRYDIKTQRHGHFKCDLCGRIYDFNVDMDTLKSDELENFNICEMNVYFEGHCPNCKLN